jgi:hypothetical protein
VVETHSRKTAEYIFALFFIIRIIHLIRIILQVDALLKTLELHGSAQHKGHFSLFNCLVIGHTKYKGVQRVYCNPFPAKTFHGSHRMDLVMIRPPGIDNGAFKVSPDSVWYARVLLLFSASAMTDTGSKTFECALVSTMETYDDPDNGNYIHYSNYTYYVYYDSFCHYYTYANYDIYTCYLTYVDYFMFCCTGWLESVGSRVVYELDYKKPVLYVIPIQSILGKLPVVPVGDTGTIPYHLRNTFPGAPGDRRMGAGDGCKMWFVNSWALGWSRDM